MFNHLYKQDVSDKCKVTIPNTVLVDPVTNLADTWLFTTKHGDVSRKKSAELSSITKRMAMNDLDQCMVYYKAGKPAIIKLDHLGTALKNRNIVAVQELIPGARGTLIQSVIRNKYHVVHASGKTTHICSKHSVEWVQEATLTLKTVGTGTKLAASTLREEINKVTLRMVRYIESFNKLRIMEIVAEFMVDSMNNIWLLWVHDLNVIRGIAAQDLTLVGDLPQQPNRLDAGGFGFPIIKESAISKRGRTEKRLGMIKEDRFNGMDVKSVGKMVNQAQKLLEGQSGTCKNDSFSITKTEHAETAHYPNPYDCQGDFCNLQVEEPKQLGMNIPPDKTTDTINMARALLTKEEMAILSRKVSIHILGDQTILADKLWSPQSKSLQERYTLPLKSIALARKEKRSRTDSSAKRHFETKKMGHEIPDPIEELRLNHGGIPLGSYYQHVNVCTKCYRVYSTLDAARSMLQEEKYLRQVANRQQHDEGNQQARDDLIAKLSVKRNRPHSRGEKHLETTPVRNARRYFDGLPKVISAEPSMVEKDNAKIEVAKALIASAVKASDGAICTRSESRMLQEQHAAMRSFNDLDGYLRGVPKVKAAYQTELGQEIKTQVIEGNKIVKLSKKATGGGYKGRVLVVEPDDETRDLIFRILEEEEYMVTSFNEELGAIEICDKHHFDLMILSLDLKTMSGVEVTKLIRKKEKKMDADVRRLPIVALTANTSPSELRLYMEVGMDGCVSKPLDSLSLLNTVKAAIPHHRPENETQPKPVRPKTVGLVTSSDVIKMTLPVPSKHNSSADEISIGVYQMDADTSFPYIVMGSKIPNSTLFNLVVCHDFFDTYETLQIFFRPILAKYPGMQILLFNFPGQGFTEWRKDAVLNNEYYADCMEGLLRHVDYNGTKEFESRGPYATPFYCMGFGNGANVAMYHAMRHKPPNLRAVLSLNGFSHVDPHLAGILHDCMNVFSCSPPTRPDLPVYFYARFLFSPAYLTKVSTPLALNLYTAVHNPITLEGRMQICKGALAHVDIRQMMQESLTYPLILVHSTQGGLIKPLHAQAIVKTKGGESKSIQQCLKERSRPCVVWLKAGHEVFQECRKPVSDLFEQLVTGYHEKHNVAFLPTTSNGTIRAKKENRTEYFEDRFIDNVLGNLKQVREEKLADPNPFMPKQPHAVNNQHDVLHVSEDPADDPDAEQLRWDNFKNDMQSTMHVKKVKKEKQIVPPPKVESMPFSLDPTKQNFYGNDPAYISRNNDEEEEVKSNLIPVELPEVREYMQWRIDRNRKKLAKLIAASNVIQRAWRAMLARTLVQRMRQKRAALFIQTRWRSKLSKDELRKRKKEDWACRLVQRNWRGKTGRSLFNEKKRQTNAARNMQKVFRGKKGKSRVEVIRNRRRLAATTIQNLVRAHIARQLTWKVRLMRNAAIDIERVYRGHRGRIRAANERDKYLFSKAQSQGIDFGRQMLLEHKLHGTRLQSEVSMLTREKVETEESVEALLSEILEFDKGVRALEREMHQLTAVETESRGILDEEAKVELREQKMRLDKEFGVMLGKIADRKDRLRILENKLQTLDRTRQSKEEELRDLERKLVVLLEEQQQELEQIKRRQETRGELVLSETCATKGEQMVGYAGPTPQQQQQANNMMQSTESLMKFGFMSMSLTYFSSMNMVRAMRKVGAMNTILSGPSGTMAGQEQIRNIMSTDSTDDETGFRPQNRPGKMPGQELMSVASWTVDDCGDWLNTLKLGQYRASFADAAIDGAFLYDLNDEDLRNTLGMEHSLHRKKILSSIKKLRRLEESRELSMGSSAQSILKGGIMGGSIADMPPMISPLDEEPALPSDSLVVHPDKLMSLTRHGKLKDLEAELGGAPVGPFDPADVQIQYIDGFGTQYADNLTRLQWFINKADEFGNTLLTVAVQNNRMKIAQLLFSKGANPDHQNNQGQTALHYAMSYNFYDLGSWLTDPSGAGASDHLNNMYGLSPYDGLTPE